MDDVQKEIMQILTATMEPSPPSRLEEIADLIFGGYGYDYEPGDPRDIYTPGLPQVGAGRYRVSPPMRTFGLDPALKLYRNVPPVQNLEDEYVPEYKEEGED